MQMEDLEGRDGHRTVQFNDERSKGIQEGRKGIKKGWKEGRWRTDDKGTCVVIPSVRSGAMFHTSSVVPPAVRMVLTQGGRSDLR